MEELYALALALVPDPDVAGDLFLAARDEDDLRSRALRWREHNGFGPPPTPLVVHPLTPEQKDCALHLVGRRKRKRRAIWGLTAGAVAVAMVAAGLLMLRNNSGYTLAADEAFTGKSVAVTDEAAGLQLSVYRVQATPGEITVWWAITGNDASGRVNDLQPELMTPSGVPREGWIKPDDVVTYALRRDRVLGRSTFRKFLPERSTRIFLRMLNNGAEQEGWNLSLSFTRTVADKAAKTVHVGKSGVVSLTTGPGYTAIRYKGSRNVTPLLQLEAGTVLLDPLGVWRSADLPPDEQMYVFPPLPDGVHQVDLTVNPGPASLTSYAVGLSRAIRFTEFSVSDLKHEGSRLEAVISVANSVVLQPPVALQTGRSSLNPSYLVHTYLGRDADGRQRWRVSLDDAGNVDPSFASLRVPILKFTAPSVHIPVELPR